MISDLEIVFIELNRMPKYSLMNIERTKRMFPDLSITLLTNVTGNSSVELLEQEGICKVEFVDLDATRVHIMSSSNKVSNSDNLFWISTLERVFLLFDWHERKPDSKLLHIESDVILFPNFPWDTFQKLDRVAWGRYSSTHDIAALVFSPNLDISRGVKQVLLDVVTAEPNLTDMTALSRVKQRIKQEVCVLPSALPELVDVMRIEQNCDVQNFKQISQEASYFDGVFDLHVVGMWLDGIDPKHYLGKSSNMPRNIYEKGESFINLSKLKFSVKENGQLVIVTPNGVREVFCLHIHSKRIVWFSKEWERELREIVESVNRGIVSNRFYVLVFIKVLIENFKQKTLLRLLLRRILPNKLWQIISLWKSKFS